ncbi:SOS-response transcriptional repressors LexA [Candidatus Termititenax persephonae]|uniref:SOS-response transcriptional repressors LexA n=1 Tax=Candidatus Termititenax persephonae TaxID=2218525 RepID=A0A388TIJ2_9BACT|nr:SOS-response transcriptional repressors LexA [Candidatus Termititenax persephonae]
MCSMKLHPIQEHLLDVLKRARNNPLTIRELQDELGLSSTSVVAHHIKQLEKKGLLKRDPANPRNYTVVGDEDGVRITYLPLYGLAQCGPKGSLLDNDPVDKIAISSELVRFPMEQMYLVKARGDSMLPKISGGDLVFVRKTNTADDGDIVVCVNEGEALIKKYQRDKKQVVLSSLNSEKYAPFTAAEDFRVEGVVKGALSYRF